jgi:hypothetical protein
MKRMVFFLWKETETDPLIKRKFHLDSAPDPRGKLNEDPCGSGFGSYELRNSSSLINYEQLARLFLKAIPPNK